MPMKPRLVVASLMPPDVVARARAEFGAVAAEGSDDMGLEEVLAALAEHRTEALLLTTTLKLNAAAIERLPEFLKIAATSSVGFDHIDVAAARARGLIVTNTPGVLTEATAELAFMLILNACRRAHEYDGIMRAGWRKRFGQGDMLGLEASGRTLGILGMGRIGQAVARRARGFGMPVLYVNRAQLPPEQEQGARYFADFREMLPHCQVLTVHAPAGPATDRMMNRETFGLLPRGAVFVNTSRGALVDEDALYEALTSGRLFAAGLDVFRSEPDYDTRFAALPNVFLTPHMASATVETRNAMGFRALDNVAAVLAGEKPIDPLWS
jgi:lactate dehydrogenase-like 2-hydroxyacid dehydrogenase